MSFLGYIILAIAKILKMGTSIYTFIIIGSVIVGWVGADPYNPIVRFLRSATDPVYDKIRSYLPQQLLRMRIDISPLIAFALIIVIDTVIVNTLIDISSTFIH